MKMKLCQDIDLNEIGFQELRDMLDLDVSLYDQDSFCYIKTLTGTEDVENVQHIPVLLECALAEVQSECGAGVLHVSVTSRETNHKDWIGYAAEYPGATITKITRNRGSLGERTCYSLMFPTEPQL